jgi:hypothetical protein
MGRKNRGYNPRGKANLDEKQSSTHGPQAEKHMAFEYPRDCHSAPPPPSLSLGAMSRYQPHGKDDDDEEKQYGDGASDDPIVRCARSWIAYKRSMQSSVDSCTQSARRLQLAVGSSRTWIRARVFVTDMASSTWILARVFVTDMGCAAIFQPSTRSKDVATGRSMGKSMTLQDGTHVKRSGAGAGGAGAGGGGFVDRAIDVLFLFKESFANVVEMYKANSTTAILGALLMLFGICVIIAGGGGGRVDAHVGVEGCPRAGDTQTWAHSCQQQWTGELHGKTVFFLLILQS